MVPKKVIIVDISLKIARPMPVLRLLPSRTNKPGRNCLIKKNDLYEKVQKASYAV